MANAKIRVNTGYSIEVNDEGDVIVARLHDSEFVDNFYNLVDKMEKVSERMTSDELKAMDEREQIEESKRLSKEVMVEFDKLFGEGSCKKVFGPAVPTGYGWAELFDQLVPIFEEYANEKQRKIAEKYNSARKGNRG